MNFFSRNIFTIATVLVLFSLIIGAFGSHWLKSNTSTDKVEAVKTAVYFLFLHALVFFIFSEKINTHKHLFTVFIGILLFSCSIILLAFLYALQISYPSFLHLITPIGGIIMILGWVYFLVLHIRKNKD